MKCKCPLYCKYCGRRRSRDWIGHYCKTENCHWQHGYADCYDGKSIKAMADAPAPKVRRGGKGK